jgi:hypothetical protein
MPRRVIKILARWIRGRSGFRPGRPRAPPRPRCRNAPAFPTGQVVARIAAAKRDVLLRPWPACPRPARAETGAARHRRGSHRPGHDLDAGWRRLRQADGFQRVQRGLMDAQHMASVSGRILPATHTGADRSEVGGQRRGSRGHAAAAAAGAAAFDFVGGGQHVLGALAGAGHIAEPDGAAEMMAVIARGDDRDDLGRRAPPPRCGTASGSGSVSWNCTSRRSAPPRAWPAPRRGR